MTVPLPLIAVGGTYREIGRQVGEAAREQITRSVTFYQANIEWLAGMSFDAAQRRALTLLPYVEAALPQYVEELAGLAEGAGLPFEHLLVLNCGEEILCGERPSGAGPTGGHCTDVAIARDGRTVVGHNEDWIEDDIENMVVLDVTVPDGTRFLSLTGAAYLPCCGFNSHGMALYGNTLYSTDERAGVPNSFKLRWMLEARDRGEADARACMAGRARGSNHVLGQAGGHIWDVETSATREATIEGGEWFAHSNHFKAESMLDVERSASSGSRRRLERARELVRDGLARGDDPVALTASVLRDHANAPSSICSHPLADDAEHGPTTGSVVVELEERRLHVCAGAPCENEYLLVTLS